jgi:hypothetical protein
MINLKMIALFYCYGLIASLVIIGIIHLYSYFFEHYFTYAVFENVLITACLSGIPFGIAIWSFSNLLKKES